MVILTETWVSDECKEKFVIDDYNCFCVSRNGRGGRIMAFCQSNVTANTIEEITHVSPVIEVLLHCTRPILVL